MSYKCISVNEAKALLENSSVILVDVRDAESYAQANIPNAINVLQETVDEFLSQTDKETPLIVYCYHGNSSKGAADYFFSQGHKEVYSLDGGFEAWRVS
ncbi:MAG: thiosulfate sulfurtransferase GlpE [Alteromonadaceae bacterium]|nr:MAG: thiosulfate sulfurtransferase GlpE [Alteromonadaceae bacterium]